MRKHEMLIRRHLSLGQPNRVSDASWVPFLAYMNPIHPLESHHRTFLSEFHLKHRYKVYLAALTCSWSVDKTKITFPFQHTTKYIQYAARPSCSPLPLVSLRIYQAIRVPSYGSAESRCNRLDSYPVPERRQSHCIYISTIYILCLSPLTLINFTSSLPVLGLFAKQNKTLTSHQSVRGHTSRLHKVLLITQTEPWLRSTTRPRGSRSLRRGQGQS